MNRLRKHHIDRTALIFGLVFSLTGLAYLVDDHGIVDVTEGAAAGALVIIVGLVMLVVALVESPSPDAESGLERTPAVDPRPRSQDESVSAPRFGDASEPMIAAPDFSWAATTEPTETIEVIDDLNPQDLPGGDEAE
jgi:hypothetical protein